MVKFNFVLLSIDWYWGTFAGNPVGKPYISTWKWTPYFSWVTTTWKKHDKTKGFL
jgi:hypothetical protein